MDYKSIFLSILLVPIAAVCNDARDKCIQQLEEQLFQKELELSNLGKMIEERDDYLASFGIDSKAIAKLMEKEVQKWKEKNPGKPFTEEARDQIKALIIHPAYEFSVAFFAACNNGVDIKDMLTGGLFRYNESDDAKEFESLKFYFIRCSIEQELLAALVKQYEKCIQDLLDISVEIESLQNNVNYRREA